MPTIDVMPITTPSTVSAERILFDRTVSNAIAITSLMSVPRIAICYLPTTINATLAELAENISSACSACSALIVVPSLLPPQRLDRIQPRRAHRRIQAEEEADQRGDADAERDRPRLD